jgi:hypothetical protein
MKTSNQKGAALVVTLIVLTALAVVAVAMITNTALDRTAVASSANIYRAELAAEAGVAAAISQIAEALGENDGSVTIMADEDGKQVIDKTQRKPLYTWIVSPEKGQTPAQAKYVGLVSGANAKLPTRGWTEDDIPGANELFAQKYANLEDVPLALSESLLAEFGGESPKAKPVTLEHPETKKEVSRYAYWVEDLQGKIDLAVAGSIAPPDARIELPNTPEDIGLFTFFDKQAETNPNNQIANDLIENRDAYLTSATINFVAKEMPSSFSASTSPELHFYAGLGFEPDTTENPGAPEIIPYGFNFENEGKPKFALNSVLAATPPVLATDAIIEIKQAISSNLPDFARLRAGGMNPDDYLSNLAANIIDYADADQNPTTNGTYRGIDSYPLVCQWMMMTWYRARGVDPANPGQFSATFALWNFVEVWNMSDQTVSGSLSFNGTNGYQLTVGGTILNFADPGEGVTKVPSPINSISVTLKPNEKKLLDFGITTYNVSTNALPPTTIPANPTWNFNYSLTWRSNGESIVDKSAGKGFGPGNPPRVFTLVAGPNPTGDVEWHAYIPGFLYMESAGSSNFLNGNVGDPRASFYITAPLSANDYNENVGVGGLTIRAEIDEDKSYRGVFPKFWPDPSPQSTLDSTLIGSDSKLPTQVTPTRTEPDRPISKIANYADSKYRSVTELGNIYDPGQWRLYSGTDMEPAKEAWKDIGGGAVADSRFGGGYTLRIGRPEFSRFDRDGARAGELLAILSTNATKSTRGLVNINTASYDALRAMAAGIRMEETSFNRPAPIHGPSEAEQGDRFARAVIESRPFFGTHQLATNLKLRPLDGSNESFWGNPAQWPPDDRPLEWRDAAAEDYLRRIYDLATVSSRNFRIHAVGQTLNPNTGKVVSQAYKTCDVYFQPNRDPNDRTKILSFKPIRLYEKNE